LQALPAVVDAVAGKIPVLLDGGVRRGGDVVKALALGATACLIGRPHLWGAAVAGSRAWRKYWKSIEPKSIGVMALCGWDDVDQVDRSVLFDPSPRSESVMSAFSRKLTAMLK